MLRCLGDRFNGIDQFKFLALVEVEKFAVAEISSQKKNST